MRAAAALLALGMLLLSGLPAHADFGAIAYDKKTGRIGWSIGKRSAERAAEAAISACGASDCKVVRRIDPKKCGAVASVQDKNYIGAVARPDRDAARLAALAECRKGDRGECVIRFAECNK